MIKGNKNRQSLINPYGFVICDNTFYWREHIRCKKGVKVKRRARSLLLVLRWEGSKCYSRSFPCLPRTPYSQHASMELMRSSYIWSLGFQCVHLRPIPIRWNVKVLFPQGRLFSTTCVHTDRQPVGSTATTAVFPVNAALGKLWMRVFLFLLTCKQCGAVSQEAVHFEMIDYSQMQQQNEKKWKQKSNLQQT